MGEAKAETSEKQLFTENENGEGITVSNTNTAREHVEQKQLPTVFLC